METVLRLKLNTKKFLAKLAKFVYDLNEIRRLKFYLASYMKQQFCKSLWPVTMFDEIYTSFLAKIYFESRKIYFSDKILPFEYSSVSTLIVGLILDRT